MQRPILIKMLKSIIKDLSSKDVLTPPVLSDKVLPELLRYKGKKGFQSLLIDVLIEYKEKKQYGRLGTGLLLGVFMEGKVLLEEVEAKGILLCENKVEKKFLDMFSRMQEISSSMEGLLYDLFRERLNTYENFCYLNKLVEPKLLRLDRQLKNRSPSLIKAVLGLSELFFYNNYFEFVHINQPDLLKETMNAVRTPEILASVVSSIVWKANHLSPIEDYEFEMPIDDEFSSSEMRDVIESGIISYHISECAKAISCFQYKLCRHKINKNQNFVLKPETTDFEYFQRLGYIRNEIAGPLPYIHLSAATTEKKLSLYSATQLFVNELGDTIAVWNDTPFPRVTVNFPYIDEKVSYKSMIGEVSFFEDLVFLNQLKDDFLLADRSLIDEMYVEEDLSIQRFLDIHKAIRFISLTSIAAVKFHNDKYKRMSNNSTVRVFRIDGFLKLLSQFGINALEGANFLKLTSWDYNRKPFYDLQYSPMLKRKDKYILLPASFSCSNILRNVQVTNKFRFPGQGDRFVQTCKELLDPHFENVIAERSIRSGKGNTEVDLIVLHKKILYLFECKYSAPPCSLHELRDIWQDIQKGVSQQLLAKDILSDPIIRQNYLAGWFPGLSPDQSNDIEIKMCVISSDRVFGGMTLDDVPVRDFPSFSAILGEHIASFSVIDRHEDATFIRYSLVGKDGFSHEDLDDYLSTNSKYFNMFQKNMIPIGMLEHLIPGNVTLCRETFTFSEDLDSKMEDRINLMDSLGFQRLPDLKKKIEMPMTVEELQKLTDA